MRTVRSIMSSGRDSLLVGRVRMLGRLVPMVVRLRRVDGVACAVGQVVMAGEMVEKLEISLSAVKDVAEALWLAAQLFSTADRLAASGSQTAIDVRDLAEVQIRKLWNELGEQLR